MIFQTDASDSRGFTLTETMVVAALMVIVGAIGVPLVSTTFHSWALYADTRNITTALVDAKIKAISQTTHYQVTFDLNNNNWTLQRYDRTGSSFVNDGSHMTLSNGEKNSGIHFQSTSSIALSGYPTSSSTFIRFNSRGIPINSSGVPTSANVIYLADGQSNYAVTASLAGRIDLLKYVGGQWVSR